MKTIKCKRTNEVVYSYREYLQTEHWKLVKLGFKKSVRHNCMKCGTKDNLEVHHVTYKNLGNEKNNQLCLLCRTCHQNTHDGGSKTLSDVAEHRKIQRRMDICRIKKGRDWYLKLGLKSEQEYLENMLEGKRLKQIRGGKFIWI